MVLIVYGMGLSFTYDEIKKEFEENKLKSKYQLI